MSDPLARANPGESAARLLDVNTFNLTMETVRAHRGGSQTLRPFGAGPSAPDELAGRLEVRVRAGLADLPIRSVVGLGDPEISPSTAPENANNTPVYAALDPVPGSAFAITVAPIGAGKIGRATILGHAVCDLVVNDAAHEYAEPIEADPTALESASSGPAKIVWKSASSGTVRAVVLIQGVGAGSADIPHAAAYPGASLSGLVGSAAPSYTALATLTMPTEAGDYLVSMTFNGILAVLGASTSEGGAYLMLRVNGSNISVGGAGNPFDVFLVSAAASDFDTPATVAFQGETRTLTYVFTHAGGSATIALSAAVQFQSGITAPDSANGSINISQWSYVRLTDVSGGVGPPGPAGPTGPTGPTGTAGANAPDDANAVVGAMVFGP